MKSISKGLGGVSGLAHDWRGVGLFTFCTACDVSLLSLGLGYKDDCHPNPLKIKGVQSE